MKVAIALAVSVIAPALAFAQTSTPRVSQCASNRLTKDTAGVATCLDGLIADIGWVQGELARTSVNASRSALIDRTEKALKAAAEAAKGAKDTQLTAAQAQIKSLGEQLSAARAIPDIGAAEPNLPWKLSIPQVTLDGEGRYLDPADLKRYLSEAHRAVKALRRNPVATEAQKDELADLEDSLHDTMNKQGMRQPIVGLLSPTFGFNQASGEGTKGEGEGSGKPEAVALRFETREAVGFGIFARVAREPALTFVRPDAKAALEPKFQAAFTWEAGLRKSLTIKRQGQVGVYGLLGQSLANPALAIADEASGGKLATVASSGGSVNFHEFGFRAVIFRQANDPEEGRVAPLLDVQIGRKRDDRFRSLTDASIPSDVKLGSNLEDRYTFRFLLGEVPILGKDFGASFGVEYEWARGNKLASATRIYLQGSADLFKNMFGADKEKKAEGK